VGLRDYVSPLTPETFQTMHQEAEHLRLLIEDLRTVHAYSTGASGQRLR